MAVKITDQEKIVAVEIVQVPDLGESQEVEVIEILVAVGDEINENDSLIVLESDKAAMEIPAPKSGVVTEILVKLGDQLTQGSDILALEASGDAKARKIESVESEAADEVATEESPVAPSAVETPLSETAPPETAPPETTTAVTPQVESQPQIQLQAQSRDQAASESTQTVSSNAEVYAGPAVRKLARELGVDLALIAGSGIRNRILKEDVHDYVKARMQGGIASAPAGSHGLPVLPEIDFSKFGEIEEVEMSKLHRVIAQNMHRNWLTVPHVTQFDEADVTVLEDFRASQKAVAEKKGIKLTPLPFIIKACAQTLVEYPQFNVSLHPSGQKLIQKKYVHIGVAVATPAGLMVPVIKNVDQKSIWDIAAEVAELGAKARDRKLGREDMEGGCFTVSSLGGLGGIGFTPIVNSPEVAILGVSKTVDKPVYINGEFVPRKIMPYSLSYDHRAVNGVDGGLFCAFLSSMLSDIRLMVL